MKCSIIGGSVITGANQQKQIEQLYAFGAWAAEHRIELLTGGCGGYPYWIGKGCVEKGGTVVGYSPARNIHDHTQIYQHPLDGCSAFVFLDNECDNVNQRFIIRSIPLVANSDIVLALEGNWGTLFELTAAILSGKTIVVWKGFGGVSDDFQAIYQFLQDRCQYEYMEKLIVADNIEDVRKIILNTATCV